MPGRTADKAGVKKLELTAQTRLRNINMRKTYHNVVYEVWCGLSVVQIYVRKKMYSLFCFMRGSRKFCQKGSNFDNVFFS